MGRRNGSLTDISLLVTTTTDEGFQEGEEAAALLAANAKTHLGGQPDYNDFMESIDG